MPKYALKVTGKTSTYVSVQCVFIEEQLRGHGSIWAGDDIEIRSDCYPEIVHLDAPTLYLRGTSKHEDDNIIKIPVSIAKKIKKAILSSGGAWLEDSTPDCYTITLHKKEVDMGGRLTTKSFCEMCGLTEQEVLR